MFENPEDVRADRALREGLERLAVPETSPDFEARIHAALHRPIPWWRAAWMMLQPALPAAGCSFAVMLALLRWSALTPIKPSVTLDAGNVRSASINGALDRADLNSPSLGYLSALLLQAKKDAAEQPSSAPPPPAPSKSMPNRHARLLAPPIA